MYGGVSGFGQPASQIQKGDPKDVEVTQPPTDSISCVAWSPTANFLIAGAWSNDVRCWEVHMTGQTVPRAQITHEAPVLCACWNHDGTTVFSAGCDNKVKCWPVAANGQPFQIGQHAAPVRCINWSQGYNVVISGSWDKTVKYWDGRTPGPVFDLPLSERVYCMDIVNVLAVIGTADRNILMYDMRMVNAPRTIQSPLKYQSRCIAVFPDAKGFAIGSIEGRVGIHYADPATFGQREYKEDERNFAFKCHRDDTTAVKQLFAVNCIAFHPRYGTFATAGSDGCFNYWDKESKQRLKPFNKCGAPIPSCAFNFDGSLFAYAVSYDWSKGSEYYSPSAKNAIFIHQPTDQEIKNRPPSQGTQRRR